MCLDLNLTIASICCVIQFGTPDNLGGNITMLKKSNPLTRWDVSSIPANGIFLTKILKNKNKNAQRVEND